MERAEFAKQLSRFLTRYDRFLLSGHIRPDGDSVGACVALALAIREMGKEAIICFDGNPTRYTSVFETIKALPDDVPVSRAGDQFTTGRNFAFIMLDCSEPDRTGRAAEGIMAASASMSIDHHVTGKEAADFNYCEPTTSSASQILFGLFRLAGIPITKGMADGLFAGVAYDTGGFRHSNADAETFAMASELRSLGVDSSFYMNYLFHTVPFKGEKAFAAAVSKAKIYAGGVLVSCMTRQDFAQLGTSPQSADGVVGNLTEVEEATVVCYLREIDDGQIRVNMRSKCDVNVARVASVYGGGGHVMAAGCTAHDPMLLVKMNLLKAIYRQMRELNMPGIPEGYDPEAEEDDTAE